MTYQLPEGYTISGNRVWDTRGNSQDLDAFYGVIAHAVSALKSNTNCTDCLNCADCVGCKDCIGCINCVNCNGSYYSSHCTNCHNCHNCRQCRHCRKCEECISCTHCAECTRCRDCNWSTNCTACSGIKDCIGWNLNKANVSIPVIPQIHQKIYAAVTARPDALNMDYWHTCDTTHCRAGWAVHLAGKAGYDLEDTCGSEVAALMIYKASSSIPVKVSEFYKNEEEALIDMKECAEREAEQEAVAANAINVGSTP